MFALPQNITGCSASNGGSQQDRAKGDFPLADDVSSLGTTTDKKGGSTAVPTLDTSVNYEGLVTRAENVADADCRETTILFSSLENQRWENCLFFLETNQEQEGFSYCGLGGAATTSAINVNNDDDDEEKYLDSKAQVQTWIKRENWFGTPTIRSLPIHTALQHKAPIRLIQKLLEIHPESVKSSDLGGNLPLHLSFQHEASDDVVAMLLKAFPEAVAIKNSKGRHPVNYAGADSAAIIQLCVEETNKAAIKEEAKLNEAVESEKTRLAEILGQLTGIRDELDQLRETKKKSPDNKTQASGDDDDDDNDDDDDDDEPEYKNDFASGMVKDHTPGSSSERKKTLNRLWAKKGRKVAPSNAKVGK